MFAWFEVWWAEWSAWWMAFFASIALLFGVTGCGLFDSHVKQMDVMRAMMADVAGRMSEGSAAQFMVNGQVQEPGITVRCGIIYEGSAFFKGTAGTASVSTQGTLAARGEGDWDAILDIVNDKSIADADRRAMIMSVVDGMIAAANMEPGLGDG